MKKILCVLTALALSLLVLVGCTSQPAQKLLADPWQNKETAVYDVVRKLSDSTEIKGTQTMTTERFNGVAVTVGEATLENFQGTKVEILTEMEDGSRMEAAVAFRTDFVPLASYKKQFVKGYASEKPAEDASLSVVGAYENKKAYTYTVIDNGVEKSDSIACKDWYKAPYIDNLMIYHIVRSSYKKGSFNPFTFSVPAWNENKMKNISTAQFSSPKFTAMGAERESVLVKITINQKFPGTGKPYSAWISQASVEGSVCTKVLLGYEEGNLLYTLKEFREN